MEKICEHLTNDRALGTLASLQPTSSCCHTLVTPFLYRHIVFDTRHAMLFIDLFYKITTKDKEKFLKSDLLVTSTHLIDKPLATRLRWYMSYTQSLTLITREDMQLRYPKDHNRLGGYNVIQSLKGTKQNQKPLWPSLEYCHIDLTAWPYHSTANKGGESSPDKFFIPEICQGSPFRVAFRGTDSVIDFIGI